MIRYIQGDATAPIGDGPKVIVHVCNDLCAWGSGFVLAVSKRWPEPELTYREAGALPLGHVQFVRAAEGLYVANMVAQHGFPSYGRRCALEYPHLATCLEAVRKFCVKAGASVHMPRIGCGIAGGDWTKVESIIARVLCDQDVTVYDLP